MLMHYFTQQDDHWRISERLRQQVTFKKHNLIDPSATIGKFDVVFCRNTLIYFDGPTKGEVLERIANQMNPGGFLMLGASETVTGLTTAFDATQDRRGLFKLASRAVKAA
jgi:chemotaxis protein methyltransferase CheR